MQERAPALYEELAKANLVIFKGDLSYRKLIADIFSEPSVDKEEVLSFRPTDSLYLRTLKSDGIVGLSSSVDVSKLEENWRNSGKYGIV